MKITIPGTELSAHLRPLRAAVRQSEGINYDKMALAINDLDGKHYLMAYTPQPSYHAFMALNLSGNESKNQSSATNDGSVAKLIDKEAVPCADNEHWMVKNSAFMQRNRSVGSEAADYVVTGNMMDITLAENSLLHLEAQHRRVGIEMPSYEEMMSMCGSSVTAHGCFSQNVLADALLVPKAVCRLSSKSGRAKEHAVHLQFYANHLRVEAMSNTAEVVYDNDKAQTMTLLDPDANTLHLSISLEAAQALAEVTHLSGLQAFWVYSREEKQLYVWCLPYVLVINAEEMNDDNCTHIVCGQYGVSMNRESLLDMARRAKSAGSTAVRLQCLTSGCVEASAADGTAELRITGKVRGQFVSPHTFHVPVSALLALVQSSHCKDIVLTFTDNTDSVVFDTMEGELMRINCV